MRLVQVFDPRLGRRVGYLDDEVVYDLTAADPENAASTLSLIRASQGRGLPLFIRGLLHKGVDPGWRWADLDVPAGSRPHLLPPIDAPEVWAAGLTYERSRDAREAESEGHADFYTLAYEAERPELFIKTSNMLRVAGPNAPIGIRTDSNWTVPEPELSLAIDGDGAIIGYTLGNDVSARDIEGENPLYLPQAKVFRGCCALGPTLYVPVEDVDSRDWVIRLRILELDGTEALSSRVSVRSMRRTLVDLVSYLCRDNDIAPGTVLMTGTGIVPEDEFSLEPGQTVEIAMEPVGVLRNPVLASDDPVFRVAAVETIGTAGS
ncbi:MAG: fumarylacetoacetate hydrolase family protein [Actinomycetota bacterium]